MNLLFSNITSILGFGFLGLSFLFVFLAYKNVKEIVMQEEPNDSAIDLSRFFMKTALVFMLCAGPLQWATIFFDNYMEERTKEVTLVLAMSHPNWEKTFGEISINEKGTLRSLVNSPYTGKFKEDDVIHLNAERVAAAIRKIRAQLTALNAARHQALAGEENGNRAPASPVTRGMLGGG
ncbi:MAG: hypothetical protein ACR2OJ_11265 [Hyphomicrobiales bacterium]